MKDLTSLPELFACGLILGTCIRIFTAPEVHREFHPNGAVEAETKYQYGKRNGTARGYRWEDNSSGRANFATTNYTA